MRGLLVSSRMPTIPAAVSLEDGAVLGIGDLLRGVLCRLPVEMVCSAFHVVDLLAIQLERDEKLYQRLTAPVDGNRPSRETGRSDRGGRHHPQFLNKGSLNVERVATARQLRTSTCRRRPQSSQCSQMKL